jgi:hypothetical protein
MHFDLDNPIPLTGLTAPALDVEAEAAGGIAAGARLGRRCKQLPDRGEDPGIGRRIGAGGATDRALINIDDLIEPLESLDPLAGHRLEMGAVEPAGRKPIQGIIDQGRFARAGDAGNTGHQSQGYLHIEPFQVVAARAFNP